jgi:hypothetical protein
MDDWFCESRNHRQEAPLQAGIFAAVQVRSRERVWSASRVPKRLARAIHDLDFEPGV